MEHPILFSGSMVKAILEGQKTQTRRVMKPQPESDGNYLIWKGRRGLRAGAPKSDAGWWFSCPYGQPGDLLWVRETFHTFATNQVVYRADNEGYEINWRPSIFMPRWASRLTLKITGVGVERLHRMGELSAKAEGVEPEWVVSVERGESYKSYSAGFITLWDSINGKRPGCAWQDNPWVWVLEFKPESVSRSAQQANAAELLPLR